MGKKPVDDFGLEILRKAATDATADPMKYALYVKQDKDVILDKEILLQLLKYNSHILRELKLISNYLKIAADEEISEDEL